MFGLFKTKEPKTIVRTETTVKEVKVPAKKITEEERQALISANTLLRSKRSETELLEHGLNRILSNLAKKYGVPEACMFDLATGEISQG